jgi:hypothetical protein
MHFRGTQKNSNKTCVAVVGAARLLLLFRLARNDAGARVLSGRLACRHAAIAMRSSSTSPTSRVSAASPQPRSQQGAAYAADPRPPAAASGGGGGGKKGKRNKGKGSLHASAGAASTSPAATASLREFLPQRITLPPLQDQLAGSNDLDMVRVCARAFGLCVCARVCACVRAFESVRRGRLSAADAMD